MTDKTTHTLTIDGFDRQTKQPTFIAIKNLEDGRDDLFLTFDTFAAATTTLEILMDWPSKSLNIGDEKQLENWLKTRGDAVLPYSETQQLHIGIIGGG